MYNTFFLALKVLLCAAEVASSVQPSRYNLAPISRSVTPLSVIGTTGSVIAPESLWTDGKATRAAIFGANSSITVDFGKNIAGTVAFAIQSSQGDNEFVGFTFTESSMWISPYQCDSGTSATFDDPLWFQVSGPGQYVAEKKRQRGGFRYMSIWHNSTGTITLGNVYVNFTAAPEMEDLQDYAGYFESDSEKLNRVWYAGAYTNQLCIADPQYGNALGISGTDWYYNASIAST